MSKLEEIITGWKNLITGEFKVEAEKRAGICSECPINKNNFCNKDLGGCGCYIPAKTSSPTSKCPIDKW